MRFSKEKTGFCLQLWNLKDENFEKKLLLQLNQSLVNSKEQRYVKVHENNFSISLLLKLKVLGIDIGIDIFNTFQMEKSIVVLGIQ